MKELVVITGGGSGLGFELASIFKNNKYDVLVLTSTKKGEIEGVNYEYGDISNDVFLKKVYQKYSKDYIVKYLINNAGKGDFCAPEDNTLKRIEQVIKSNLIGLILNTTHALPLMKEFGGKIVNIMSTASLKVNANESLYCASKWGARGFTDSLKAAYKGTNIRVIGIFPGGMNTAFWNNNRNYVSSEKSEKWMNPRDVAEVIFNNITNDKISVSDLVIEKI